MLVNNFSITYIVQAMNLYQNLSRLNLNLEVFSKFCLEFFKMNLNLNYLKIKVQ